MSETYSYLDIIEARRDGRRLKARVLKTYKSGILVSVGGHLAFQKNATAQNPGQYKPKDELEVFILSTDLEKQRIFVCDRPIEEVKNDIKAAKAANFSSKISEIALGQKYEGFITR